MSSTNMTIVNRTAITAFAALTCAAGLIPAGCGAKQDAAGGPAGPAPLTVTAQPVRQGTLVSTFALTGTIAPERQANLASVISGTVRDVNVQIGDPVSAGTVLVQIDDSTLRAQLAQDEASLAEAR